MPLLLPDTKHPPKIPVWTILRIAFDKEYTQGLLFTEDRFICFTHEYPEKDGKPFAPGQCLPAEKMTATYLPYLYRWGIFKGPEKNQYQFVSDPDELRRHDIAVGIKIAPHGVISGGDDAMGRLRALSHGYKKVNIRFMEARETPPDWMASWLTKQW